MELDKSLDESLPCFTTLYPFFPGQVWSHNDESTSVPSGCLGPPCIPANHCYPLMSVLLWYCAGMGPCVHLYVCIYVDIVRKREIRTVAYFRNREFEID